MNAALLLIDVINPLGFEGAERLMPHARQAAAAIGALKHRAHVAGVPVVYVNDNYGRWDLGFAQLVQRMRDDRVPGAALIDDVEPDTSRDSFILKPKHSAFYCTSLDVFLAERNVRRLVMTGIAGNICVLFSANDAHMRGYELAVPSDCIASETPEDNAYALRQMERVLGADTRPSPRVPLVRGALRARS